MVCIGNNDETGSDESGKAGKPINIASHSCPDTPSQHHRNAIGPGADDQDPPPPPPPHHHHHHHKETTIADPPRFDACYSDPTPTSLYNYAHHRLNPHPNIVIHTMFPRPADDAYSFFETAAGTTRPPDNAFWTASDRVAAHSIRLELDAHHFLSSLKGPDLELLKEPGSGELEISDEKWPFLLRFPIGFFGVCLGLGSQSILWKTLAAEPSLRGYVPRPGAVNLALWCLALASFCAVSGIYAAKCVLHFGAVRREFGHPVRVNFFFAPWIAGMFLALGLPPAVSAAGVNATAWAYFMAPVLALELKVYGQWLSGGERRLSRVANPSTHLSLVGNFVGALLAARLGAREFAIFFWAVGLAHYLVLFVTLYQRLPSAAAVPRELHPVFFLFVAAPSTASVAWAEIAGAFDLVSRISYFVSLFLYTSLAVRVNFFCGFRFTVAWWAYTFPMTASAIATIHYAREVGGAFTRGLAIALSAASSATVLTLAVLTILHVFVWRTMFPNDMAIAVSAKPTEARCSRMKASVVDDPAPNPSAV